MTEMLDIDSAWSSFCDGDYNINSVNTIPQNSVNKAPKCGQLYISTRTKISYLSQKIELANLFWKIPIIPYEQPCNGVIKKQMKFNSTCQEQLDNIQANLTREAREEFGGLSKSVEEMKESSKKLEGLLSATESAVGIPEVDDIDVKNVRTNTPKTQTANFSAPSVLETYKQKKTYLL